MPIKQITDRLDWENFQSTQKWMQFSQSWVWGEFLKSLGRDVKRFALLDDQGQWLCALQAEYRKRSMGLGYWNVPRGPLFSTHLDADCYREVLTDFIMQLHERKSLPKSLFWRFEPLIKAKSLERLLPPRFLRAPALSPAATLLLDLHKTEEELLAGMHQKTRYNIKVALKHEVTIRTTNHPQDFERFLKLMATTAERNEIVQHDDSYMAKSYYTLAAAHMARLRVAEINGAMIAANMEIKYGNTVTYLYGASSNKMRHVMAPYLLQWEAIKEAKNDGADLYDFWGINLENVASPLYKKSWEGITRFKLGWGGERVELIGTWDLPFNFLLYRLAFFKRLMKPY
ncbi:peptidoglycan bridge formation glycyltransferase FemA/FemB family protein [Patescibacteria group bacterium]|nr:peptidoglycan bridge formation glycyltransferase FemA/FemB family protein [Patescibacteria group bacterium]